MKKAQRVNISFCTDCLDGDLNDTDIFSSIKTAYRKLVKMAKENGIPVEPSVVLNSKPLFRFSQSPELSHLEQYLYAYPYKTYNEKTKDISLFLQSIYLPKLKLVPGTLYGFAGTGECATGRLPCYRKP